VLLDLLITTAIASESAAYLEKYPWPFTRSFSAVKVAVLSIKPVGWTSKNRSNAIIMRFTGLTVQ
jgi:hypothetical protein